LALMPYAFFKVRANEDGSEAARLNAFLRSHRILAARNDWVVPPSRSAKSKSRAEAEKSSVPIQRRRLIAGMTGSAKFFTLPGISMIEQLSAVLWDANPARLDLERHAGFIIRRVLERGTLAEWRAVRSHYGDERIEREADAMPRLDPKALRFVAVLFGRPPESFACYTSTPSQPAPWIS
jgi:hypothetical protein